jgi:putative transposase
LDVKPPRRKSIRLPGYDYSQEGVYFVTLVTKHRESLFGEIINDEMSLNEFGKIVEFTWHDLINHNSNIDLDEFIIMPNHFHGIIHIVGAIYSVGAGSQPAPGSQFAPNNRVGLEPGVENRVGFAVGAPWRGFCAKGEPTPTKTSLMEIMRQFKTFSARRINTLHHTPGASVWQRSFYDHIIDTGEEYENFADYIFTNPQNWLKDKERPE